MKYLYHLVVTAFLFCSCTTEEKGSYLEFLFETENNIFLKEVNYETTREKNSMRSNSYSTAKYIFNKESKELNGIFNLKNEDLGLQFNDIKITKNNKVLSTMASLAFKNTVKRLVKDKKTSTSAIAFLTKLDSEIVEGDNPILFVSDLIY